MASFPRGYLIGHATDSVRRTGCTIILPPAGTNAAVDVRGGAPGTRETGVFTPGNLVSEIHGLLFTGGSAFGLAAAGGVMTWLRKRGVGFAVGPVRVPIVAAAVLFDLAAGDSEAFPDEAMGLQACDTAEGVQYDVVIMLQPTSPLRTSEDIDACIEKAHSNGFACVSFNDEGRKNGAVYVAHKDWIAEHDFTHAGYAKYVMPMERSVDIDYPEQIQ